MKSQRGNQMLVPLLIVAILLVLGVYFIGRSQKGYAPTSRQQESSREIQSSSGLNQASSDLDAVDVDSTIDTGLSQNDSDASSF